MKGTEYTFTSVRAKLSLSRILAALETPMTANQLCAKLHKSRTGTLDYLRHLMQEPKRVYIIGHESGVGRQVPIYALGSLPDAPEPKRKTSAERYAMMVADKEAHAKNLAYRRERDRLIAGRSPSPPPVTKRIAVLLESYPRSTSLEIATRLGVDRRITVQNLQRLRHRGTVRLWTPDKKRRAVRWELTAKPEISDGPIRRIERAWVPLPVQAQNPFSALFTGGAHA